MILDEKEYRLLELINRKKDEDLTYNKLFKLATKEDVIRAKPTFNNVLRKLENLGLVEREYVQEGTIRRSRIKTSLLGEILVIVKYLERYVQVLESSKNMIDVLSKIYPALSEKISLNNVCDIVLPAFRDLLTAMYTAVYVAKIPEDTKTIMVSELSKQLYFVYKRVLDLFPFCAKKTIEERSVLLRDIFKQEEEVVDLDFIRRVYGEEAYDIARRILEHLKHSMKTRKS